MEYNFMDLHDMLSPEDQAKMIGILLKSLNGEEVEPVMSRITLTLSNLGTEEELQQRIAKALGIPIRALNISSIRGEIERNRADWMKVNEIIEPLKSLMDSSIGVTSDKYEELNDLGRFIISLHENLEVVVGKTLLKYPDFIIKKGNEHIGIEHTRLIEPELKAINKIAKQYLDNAQSKLVLRDKTLYGTVNVCINYNKSVINGKNFKTRDFTKKERDQISSMIADYIESQMRDTNIMKPEFIDTISITDNLEPKLDIELSEQYIAKDGFTDLINARIEIKERKFVNYIMEESIEKCWLLIVVDGINGFSGFDLKTESMNVTSTNKFEKIILFETFSGNIRYL